MQRKTIQRQIIMDVLQRLHHPTVIDVNTEIQKNHPSISKTTIYRNLRQMYQDGMIVQLWIPGDAERYDKGTAPHYHFKCRCCGGILDVEMEYLCDLNQKLQCGYPHEVERHDIAFSGVCNDCKSS